LQLVSASNAADAKHTARNFAMTSHRTKIVAAGTRRVLARIAEQIVEQASKTMQAARFDATPPL
jgi:hypothetical protein